MMVLISRFRSTILGSAGSACLALSLSSMSFDASDGIEVLTLGILPAGMYFLAALFMMFLRNFSFL